MTAVALDHAAELIEQADALQALANRLD